MGRILGGSMNWDFFDPTDMSLVLKLTSATDSGLNSEVQNTPVLGGQSNKKYANYYYGGTLKATATSCLFNLSYFEARFGVETTLGAKIETSEEITTTVENTITVTGTPIAPPAKTAITGTYRLSTSTEDMEDVITFTGQNATVSGIAVGTVVCVKYWVTDLTAKNIVIPTTMIPKTLYAVGKANEFDAGEEGTVNTSSSKVGEFQVVIPRAQFDPNGDLAMTSSGTANVPLSFEALANKGTGCSAQEYYAIWSETTVGAEAFDTCVGIGVIDGDIDLAVNGTSTINVVAKYSNVTGISAVDNSLLTFTSLTPATCTVGLHTGIVTALIDGTSIIEVSITSKPAISTTAVVTVTT